MLIKALKLLALSASVLFWTGHANAQLSCIWEGGIVACPEDCAEKGGLAQCTAPIITGTHPDHFQRHEPGTMFTYTLCNNSNLSTGGAWCSAAGGTNYVENSTLKCADLPEWALAGNVLKAREPLPQVSDNFVGIVYKLCSDLGITDTGWGQSGIYDACSLDAPIERNGFKLLDFRQREYSGMAIKPSTGECSYAVRTKIQMRADRRLVCPFPYKGRSLPNGNLACYQEVAERCPVGNPIYLPTGEKCQVETDYSAGGTGGLTFTRHYRSGSFFRPTWEPAEYTDGAAERWRHSYQHKLHVAPADNTHILGIVARANGTLMTFDKSGKEIVHLQGGRAHLEHDAANQRYRLIQANASIEDYAEDGRLLSITNRAGRTITLNYNGALELTSIEDAHGRTLVLTDSDADGLIDSITPPDGQTISYTYNDLGLLETITYPNSEQRTYHYDDPNYLYGLSGITDENNQRFASWEYDVAHRAVMSEHASGAERVNIEYRTNGDVWVTDSLNNVHTYEFQSVGGKIKLRSSAR